MRTYTGQKILLQLCEDSITILWWNKMMMMKVHMLIQSFQPQSWLQSNPHPPGRRTALRTRRLLNDHELALGDLGKGSPTLKFFQSKSLRFKPALVLSSLSTKTPSGMPDFSPFLHTDHGCLWRPLPKKTLFMVLLEKSLFSIWWGS